MSRIIGERVTSTYNDCLDGFQPASGYFPTVYSEGDRDCIGLDWIGIQSKSRRVGVEHLVPPPVYSVRSGRVYEGLVSSGSLIVKWSRALTAIGHFSRFARPHTEGRGELPTLLAIQ